MFARAEKEDGTLHLALYELDDPELVDLLVQNQARLHLILSTAGSKAVAASKTGSRAAAAKAMVKRSKVVKKAKKKKTAARKAKKVAKKVSKAKKANAPKKAAKKAAKKTAKAAKGAAAKPKKTTVWDVTNAEAREKLSALMGDRFQNRMFNNSAHIGHNKFAVLLDKQRQADRGVVGQHQLDPDRPVRPVQQHDRHRIRRPWRKLISNTGIGCMPTNCRSPIRSARRSAATRVRRCARPMRHPSPAKLDHGKTKVDLWYSPNTSKTGTPKNRTVPPDLAIRVLADEEGQGRDLLPGLQPRAHRSRRRGRQHRRVRRHRFRPAGSEAYRVRRDQRSDRACPASSHRRKGNQRTRANRKSPMPRSSVRPARRTC